MVAKAEMFFAGVQNEIKLFYQGMIYLIGECCH